MVKLQILIENTIMVKKEHISTICDKEGNFFKIN